MNDAKTHSYTVPAKEHEHNRVLFVHGLISSSIVWNKTTPLLDNTKNEFIFYDLYARGKSEIPQTPLTLDLYATQLAQIVEKHAIGASDTIVALSWGCGVVTKYLLNNRSKMLKRIIFLAPGGLYSPNIIIQKLMKIKVLPDLIFYKFQKYLLEKEFKNCFYQPSLQKEFYLLLRQETEQNKYLLKSLLQTIRTSPNLFFEMYKDLFQESINISIIWGTKDKKSPYKKNKNFFLKNNISIDTIEDCGHLITWERPKVVAKLLMEKICQK